jgi:flagella basal body P-ring formation protein FlgA
MKIRMTKSEFRNKFRSPIFKLVVGSLVVISSFWFGRCSLALDNPEQRVTETIKNYIVNKFPDWPRDEIILTYKMADSAFASLKDVPEAATLEVIEVYPNFKPVGSVVFPIRASAGLEIKKVMVRAKVEVIRKVVAAARLIKKSASIEAADLKTDSRDVALLPQKYFVSVDALIGKGAKISIPENSTIFDWMVGAVPLVHRGDIVSLLALASGLTVKTTAQAQEDGLLGSEIKVKRADSPRKMITARVISSSEVEVKL